MGVHTCAIMEAREDVRCLTFPLSLIPWKQGLPGNCLGWWSTNPRGPHSSIPHRAGSTGEHRGRPGIFHGFWDPNSASQACTGSSLPHGAKTSRKDLFIRRTMRWKSHMHSLLFLWMAYNMAVPERVCVTSGSFRMWSARYLQQGNCRFSLHTVCWQLSECEMLHACSLQRSGFETVNGRPQQSRNERSKGKKTYFIQSFLLKLWSDSLVSASTKLILFDTE